MVDRLAEVYKERRVAVIAHIDSRPLGQVRAFSDAINSREEK